MQTWMDPYKWRWKGEERRDLFEFILDLLQLFNGQNEFTINYVSCMILIILHFLNDP